MAATLGQALAVQQADLRTAASRLATAAQVNEQLQALAAAISALESDLNEIAPTPISPRTEPSDAQRKAAALSAWLIGAMELGSVLEQIVLGRDELSPVTFWGLVRQQL